MVAGEQFAAYQLGTSMYHSDVGSSCYLTQVAMQF